MAKFTNIPIKIYLIYYPYNNNININIKIINLIIHIYNIFKKNISQPTLFIKSIYKLINI